jgi:prepilin signal peptidase PulO-like enzyme (type II secretory pathway)
MNRNKYNYLLICILVSSGFLFAVNFYVDFAITRFTGYVKIGSVIFLILTLISVTTHTIKRTTKTFNSSIIVASIFFLLNTVLVTEIVALEIHGAKLYKIEKQLETCEKAKNQFRIDLENDDLKYFTFGMGIDEEYNSKLEDMYGLEVYHMGCIVYSSYVCYNELVEKELKMAD